MNIAQQEKELFDRWSMGRGDFVRDGVVDEIKYSQSPLSLCFVLKEVNGRKEDSWDLRGFLQKGGRPDTWDNIARWTHGLSHLSEDIDWSIYQTVTDEFRISELSKVAAFNLKKSSGGHTAVATTLNKAVDEDKDYIKQQFEIYDANITVCGGTGGQLSWALGLDKNAWKTTSRGVDYIEHRLGKFIVSFSHPAARVADSFLHYALVDAVREILPNQP